MLLRNPPRRFVRPVGRTAKLLGMVQVVCTSSECPLPLCLPCPLYPALPCTMYGVLSACLLELCRPFLTKPSGWQLLSSKAVATDLCMHACMQPCDCMLPAACRQPNRWQATCCCCPPLPAVGLTAAFYCLVGMFGYLNFPANAHSNILLNYSSE